MARSGDAAADAQPLALRVFGTRQFQRLWYAQVVSALGDWLGFLAVVVLAARVGAGSPGASVGLVMAARIVPGLLFSAGAGVVVDRFDRKRLMVTCSLVQAAVVAYLPFADTVAALVAASLVLELCTLLWSPAKEASVPHLVPAEHLTTANSLSLAAAYGTFPLAAGLYSILTGIASGWNDSGLAATLHLDEVGLAFYVDALTFVCCALLVSTLALPRKGDPGTEERVRARQRVAAGRSEDDPEPTRGEVGVEAVSGVLREVKEGWHHVVIDPTVRAVEVGLATGLIGGAMLVPLGPVFATEVLGVSDSGFGVLVFALGVGVALGVCALSLVQGRLPKPQAFTIAVFVAGGALVAGASMSSLGLAALFVGLLGVCAGAVYVLGFTLLHESVDDALRGRVFAALYTLVRLCVLVAFALGPLLTEVLGRLSDAWVDGELSVGAVTISIPGVRLTLWLAGAIIVGAGVLVATSLRQAARQAAATEADEARRREDEEAARHAGLSESFEHTLEDLAIDDWAAHHPEGEG